MWVQKKKDLSTLIADAKGYAKIDPVKHFDGKIEE